MSILFSASEVVTMAIEIEKNGLDFYNAMAVKTGDEKAKELYTFLAGEEVRHKITFQKMLDSLPKAELSAAEEEEYNNYLGALTSSRVFRTDIDTDELVAQIGSDIAAIDMAIEAEKDSILFYYELMDQAFDEDRGEIENIIKEEKSHYTKLVALKGQMIG